MNHDVLTANLQSVRARIAASAARSGRSPSAVRFVAVTKRVPIEAVRALVDLDVRDLGENYPQALWARVEAMAGVSVRWHLIGHLQGNKARRTFPMVRSIHAVDSLKLLLALDALAADRPDPPSACLQVNTSGEPSKHGWSVEGILADAEAIAGCRNLPVVGLMTMAALDTTPETARPSFVMLRQTRDALRARSGLPLEELSMGMSSDFETAVEEGATLVRVGSALFEGVVP